MLLAERKQDEDKVHFRGVCYLYIYIYIQGKPTEYKKLLHCFINEEFTAADAQQHQHMHVFPLVDYNAALESLKSRDVIVEFGVCTELQMMQLQSQSVIIHFSCTVLPEKSHLGSDF